MTNNSSHTVKTVLIISPHFPPATLAGVHRARHMAKHLGAFGWEPIVIRVDESHYTESLDPALGVLVPPSVKQVRTGAFPASIARIFGFGDVGLRAYLPIKRAIAASIITHDPRIIFITGSPYYPLLLSGWIKKTFGIPVVLDLQDPWVSAEGALRPLLSKGGVSHQLANFLEPRAIRHADFITSVSDQQNQDMADRYTWLNRAKMAAIQIGGDPDDFDALRAAPITDPLVKLDKSRINLSYVGTFLPRAGPLVEALFKALKALRDEQPALAARLFLTFVGTSNQPDGGGLHRIMPIAEAAGVADQVLEVPQRVPYLDALNILANSDALMLIGSDEPHYTASKIYPALMSGVPFISIFHEASSAHQILMAAGGGFTHSFSELDKLPRISSALKGCLAAIANKRLNLPKRNSTAYEAYTATNIAKRFAEIFNGLVR